MDSSLEFECTVAPVGLSVLSVLQMVVPRGGQDNKTSIIKSALALF